MFSKNVGLELSRPRKRDIAASAEPLASMKPDFMVIPFGAGRKELIGIAAVEGCANIWLEISENVFPINVSL